MIIALVCVTLTVRLHGNMVKVFKLINAFCCTSSPPVLWNVYGDCENYAVMKGHTGAIMELHFSADGR